MLLRCDDSVTPNLHPCSEAVNQGILLAEPRFPRGTGCPEPKGPFAQNRGRELRRFLRRHPFLTPFHVSSSRAFLLSDLLSPSDAGCKKKSLLHMDARGCKPILTLAGIVRLTRRRRSAVFARRKCEQQQREDVRQHVQELVWNGLGPFEQLRLEAQRLGKAEEQGRPCRADRMPAPEDDRRDRDEALAADRRVREIVRRCKRDRCAAETGERAAQHDADVAVLRDADADGVRRAGMLADGAQAQAEAGPVQDEPAQEHEHVADVRGRVSLEQRFSDERNIREDRDVPLGEGDAGQVLRLALAVEQALDQVDGRAQGKDIDDDPDNDLVGL
ncbi:hypothetical protein BN871_HV_00020 [Paenibacillus sp. P22]|nr:hypothetical protein BN871_HV_00020 [Paenibacillus sp. P22]